MLVSSSQRNVASGMNAMRESRSATMSYMNGRPFSTEPSANQPPAGMPANVTDLPAGERL